MVLWENVIHTSECRYLSIKRLLLVPIVPCLLIGTTYLPSPCSRLLIAALFVSLDLVINPVAGEIFLSLISTLTTPKHRRARKILPQKFHRRFHCLFVQPVVLVRFLACGMREKKLICLFTFINSLFFVFSFS